MKTYFTSAQRILAERITQRGQTAAICRATATVPTKLRYIAMGQPPRVDEAWAICQALGLPWTAWLPEAPAQKEPGPEPEPMSEKIKTADSLLSEEAAKDANPVDLDDILNDV